jgi:hypothetical protein
VVVGSWDVGSGVDVSVTYRTVPPYCVHCPVAGVPEGENPIFGGRIKKSG